MNDPLATLTCFLAVELLGLAALPLALRWLRWLPDRGYSFAKPLGILLVSYVVWLGASLGIVDNSAPAVVLIALVLALACWLWAGGEVRGFWSHFRRLILGSEVLFALAFVLWVYVRSHDPAIAATEKPMEIAFLSGTMRSAQFPPVDPWLSGYGISYYYFGYVMVSVVAKLAAVPSTAGFNLAIALLFALTVSGAFSLGYNLVAKMSGEIRERGRIVAGLTSALLVAIAGNLEAIVELLNARGMLSAATSRWIQIKDLPAPYVAPGWLPVDNWWWFRATRVVGDFDPATNASRDYTINEFPFFSFLLGDLHPHVLALPFALLALAAALNLLCDEREWTPALLRARRLEWLLFGLVIGGLGFLNSWDMPAYLLVLGLAFGVHRYQRIRRFNWALIREVFGFGAVVLLAGLALYLPFYLGFRSQAVGLGLVAVRTKLQHLGLFWTPLFALAVVWLIGTWRGSRLRREMPLAGARRDRPAKQDKKESPWLLISSGAILAVALIVVRAEVAAVLLALLALGGYAFARQARCEEYQPGAVFAGLLLLCALFLIFICEWVFIRDFFNNRMNTVFKLYYQAWLMMAVAGGPVLYFFAIRNWKPKPFRISSVLPVGWRVSVAVLLAATLVYPLAATWAKTEGFSTPATLDGLAFMDRSRPDDSAAIRWLQSNVRGTPVIVEATGGSYGPAGRVAAFTGLPTLLGWDFHEQQWRGSYDEQGKRKADIERIYSTTDRAAAETLLRKYGAKYVFVGSLEREGYGKFGPAALDKFAAFMDVVYRNNGVTIYQTRG